MKNITRLSPEKYKKCVAGWWVRIHWEGKRYSKSFSDKKNGGKNSALLSAMVWRDKIKCQIGMPVTDLRCVGRAKSNTGHVGVTWDEKCQCFYVTWVDAVGHPGRTSVAARKIGYDRALEKAIAKRKEKVEWRVDRNVSTRRRVLGPRDTTTYTEEDLILALLRKNEELGRLPTSRDFMKSQPAKHRFESKFGGWKNALRAAGLI